MIWSFKSVPCHLDMDAIIAPLFAAGGSNVIRAAEAIGVRAKQTDSGCEVYWQLDYDMLKADWRSPVTWWCRGLVTTHDGHVVCCPMRKFFNLGENPGNGIMAEPIQWDRVKAYEKLDGTMVNRWYHNGRWHVSTRYNMGSGLCKHLMSGMSMDRLIDAALATLDLFPQPVSETWTFEVCAPHNRIVVKYDTIQAHLISRRITATGQELDIDSFPFACPQYSGVAEPDGAKRVASSKPGLESEGLVVFDGKTRLKVKNVHYMNYFRIKSQPPWKTVVDAWSEGDQSEVVLYAPQLAPIFERLNELVRQAKAAAEQTLLQHDKDDQKAFAAAAKQHHSLVSQWLFLRRRQVESSDLIDWMRHHPGLQRWAKDVGLPAVLIQAINVDIL